MLHRFVKKKNLLVEKENIHLKLRSKIHFLLLP